MPRRVVGALIVSVISLAACGLGGPGTFEGRIAPGPLVVTDESRTIASVDFAPISSVEVDLGGVAAVPDAPKKLAIGWVVGGCGGPSSMVVTGSFESIEIAIRSPRCSEQRARDVQIHLVFARPIDPGDVRVDVTYGPIAAGTAVRRTG
ncbi:MAG TPA: hypothetical protein VFX65_08625 [Candidatus Limnocylindrales bacterium]|nr:hypothetical protein [Candidatus Limnocylindrales bacterium]